jgi:hypothetical protein
MGKNGLNSLYGGYGTNHKVPLQAISEIWDLFRTVLDPRQNEIVSVVAFRIAEKRRLRKLLFRQSPPRCVMVPLQTMSFADLDLPKMHFVPVRGLNASHWTGVHLGEV